MKAGSEQNTGSSLHDIFWIGGVSCSGKSSVARTLGERSALSVYETDATFADHARMAQEACHPTMFKYQTDDEWLARVRMLDPKAKAKVWLEFYRERFGMIVRDLIESDSRPIIAEGVDLLPEMVMSKTTPDRSVWLVPSRGLFDKVYVTRPWATEEPSEEVWSYYSFMIDHICSATRSKGYPVIEVSDIEAIEQITESIAVRFGLE